MRPAFFLGNLSWRQSRTIRHVFCTTGTHGRIRIHSPWWRPVAMTLSREGKSDEQFDFPLEGNGYQYEAQEVMDCLRSGRLESPVMPLDESVSIMRTLDAIRAQWGLRYPME